MRFFAFCIGLSFLSVLGCETTKPARQVRPPKVEEFGALPESPDGKPLDPPAYPEEKKLITMPKSTIPAGMKDGGAGMGGSGPIKGGGGGGSAPGAGPGGP